MEGKETTVEGEASRPLCESRGSLEARGRRHCQQREEGRGLKTIRGLASEVVDSRRRRGHVAKADAGCTGRMKLPGLRAMATNTDLVQEAKRLLEGLFSEGVRQTDVSEK